MKAIYLSLMARLQSEVPEIKWIDEDNGQLDGAARPAVSWPCCLIDISYPRCEDITDTEQSAKVAIGIRLGWDVKADTAANIPESIRNNGLSPYGLIDKTHRCLQGFLPSGCSDTLSRTAQKKATTRAAFTYDMSYESVCED